MSISRQLVVLGIESSCDETATGVILWQGGQTGRLLSNVVRSQHQVHAPFGGVVPEAAARAHVEVLDHLIAHTLKEAEVTLDTLDGIAATAGPGLAGGLMVGLTTAKTLAWAREIPFVAVNHLEGHALTVGLTDGLRFPYLLLLISGGHTQLVSVFDLGVYQGWGSTRDDAVGESFDKAARLLGLGFPGGPALETAAQKAVPSDTEDIALPRPLLGTPGCQMSFSGLKTALRKEVARREPLSEESLRALAYAFQEAICDCLADRIERAMALHKEACDGAPLRFVASGGVAANRSLRQRLRQVAQTQGFELTLPPAHLCTDNGAMIAWAGAQRLARGESSSLDSSVHPRWPLETMRPPPEVSS